MRPILFFLFLLTSLAATAQLKRLEKARQQYDAENYEKAYKTIQKVLDHKETKSNPDAFLLDAKILLRLHGNGDFPKALPDALKQAEKALKKSKDPGTLYTTEQAFFSELYTTAIQEAENELAAKRYIQAEKYYSKLYEMYGTLPAKWGSARVALALADTLTAIQISSDLIKTVFDSMEAAEAPANLPEGPFVLVIDHYIKAKNYDTAAYYAERAADLYPSSAVLKGRLLKSFLLLVTANRPDINTLQIFALMRPRFKGDSVFVHKETVLFLYLMNYYAGGEQTHMSDSLLAGFIAVKNDYYTEFGEKYRRQDPLYSPDNSELVFNLITYTARFERQHMLAMLLNNYVGGQYADSSYRAKSRPERWRLFFERMRAERSVFLLSTSFEIARQELKRESWFAAYQKTVLTDALDNPGQFKDRTGLYAFVPYMLDKYPTDVAINQKVQKLSKGIIKEFTDSAYYSYARLAIKQHDLFYRQDEEVKALKRNFVVRDYRDNYYGSRLLRDSVDGRLVSEFVWTGNDLLCDAGFVPAGVQDKVEQRINYFRRAAGVPDYVRLDTVKNQACQKAALIYQVNTGKMFTEPAETWKCYAFSGVEAAQLSARVIGQNTVFAVTSLMADMGEDNISVGNRRWMLYPPAQSMGHGSTNKVALIWTLDQSGDMDSSMYMTDFVSWPPRDYCPTMFAFPRWSFSLYADLSKAKVSMTVDGKKVELTQEKMVGGYGMPTLVWKPSGEMVPGKVYQVTVSGVLLHGDRTPVTYTYSVEFIDPMK